MSTARPTNHEIHEMRRCLESALGVHAEYDLTCLAAIVRYAISVIDGTAEPHAEPLLCRACGAVPAEQAVEPSDAATAEFDRLDLEAYRAEDRAKSARHHVDAVYSKYFHGAADFADYDDARDAMHRAIAEANAAREAAERARPVSKEQR